MSFYKGHAPSYREHKRPLPDYTELEGMRALKEETGIPVQQWREEVRRGKEFGLECVDSIEDKTEISCFQRGELPHWSGINTFLKTHYQITKAVAHVLSQGTLPMIMGGDHSIGFPCARGVAQCIEGNVGIIHLDRHIDTQEKDMDEIMHTCPWFHATNIPNCPPTNLVQVGIGGWQVPRPGVKKGRERGSTVLTIQDIERIGIDKTVEIALEVAWKGASAVYLSFDVDSIDAGFVPGTGWPEPGGFLPREALAILKGVAKEGVAAMEAVEVSPPCDIPDITASMAVRAMVDVQATRVRHRRIGGK